MANDWNALPDAVLWFQWRTPPAEYYARQIRNHQVAPLHTCHFFNIVILVAIWHAMFKHQIFNCEGVSYYEEEQLNNTIFRWETAFY